MQGSSFSMLTACTVSLRSSSSCLPLFSVHCSFLHTTAHRQPSTTIKVWCATATRILPRRLVPRAIARAATGPAGGGEGWGAIGAGAAEAVPPSTIAVQRPQPARAGETVEQLRSRLLYVVNENILHEHQLSVRRLMTPAQHINAPNYLRFTFSHLLIVCFV